MLLIPDKGVMFLAIPKTGSMAVTNSLWGHFKNVTSFTGEEQEAMNNLHYGHGTLVEIAEAGLIDVEQYPKRFATVRNPYDRVVSYAAWKFPQEFAENSNATMYKALWEDEILVRPQSVYCHDTVRLLRFESLFVEYSALAKEWGIEATPLVTENESKRDRDYRKYYDDTLRSIVEQKYAKDLELFNYTF